MKIILQLAMAAYPLEWRRRYGSEFVCLLEDARSSWRDVLDVFTGGIRMRYSGTNIVRTAFTWGITLGVLGLLISWLFAVRMPNVFEAHTAILLPQNQVAAGPGSFAESMRSDHLLRIVQTYDLYKQDPPESRVDMLRRNLRVTVLRDRLIDVSYQGHNPAVVAQVTNQLASLTIEDGLKKIPGQRFTIIDPARIPEIPTRPNRMMIMSVGTGCGIVLGAIIALLRRRPIAPQILPQ